MLVSDNRGSGLGLASGQLVTSDYAPRTMGKRLRDPSRAQLHCTGRNTHNTSDTSNTSNAGNTSDTSNTSSTSNTGNTSDTSNTRNTRDSMNCTQLYSETFNLHWKHIEHIEIFGHFHAQASLMSVPLCHLCASSYIHNRVTEWIVVQKNICSSQ